jgi:hypothetical protein
VASKYARLQSKPSTVADVSLRHVHLALACAFLPGHPVVLLELNHARMLRESFAMK